MKSNRQLQAQLDAEKQRNEPLTHFAADMQRVHAQLDRAEQQRLALEQEVRIWQSGVWPWAGHGSYSLRYSLR
jgi:hypothetical protein